LGETSQGGGRSNAKRRTDSTKKKVAKYRKCSGKTAKRRGIQRARSKVLRFKKPGEGAWGK